MTAMDPNPRQPEVVVEPTEIPPQYIIDQLVQRLANLEMENATLRAQCIVLSQKAKGDK